jgi:NADH-quinone oxidoreductase subunit L
LSSAFSNYYANLGLEVVVETPTGFLGLSGLGLELLVAIASALMVVIGAVPAYIYYIKPTSNPGNILPQTGVRRRIYNFLWNRWYINAFYTKVFVQPSIRLGSFVQRHIETPLNNAMNGGVPEGFQILSSVLRKFQTGKLRINMVYFLVAIVIALILLWLGGLI